ncbi:MAG: maleylpyruvate isomerase family mycothiol-dependent enzyme [Acidimicrobiia bacterium]
MASADISALYAEGLQRLADLAADIDDGTSATPVQGTPGWTVKDVYAHQAGVAADVLAGRVEGVGTDAWTSRQVAERAGRSFADVVAELAANGTKLVEALDALGDQADFRLAADQWNHEQDIRTTLGRPGARDVDAVRICVTRIVNNLGRKWMKSGWPAAFVVGDGGHWLMGAGETQLELRTDDYELMRIFAGRRSRDQVMEMWEGPEDEVDEVIDHLVIFKWAEAPIYED